MTDNQIPDTAMEKLLVLLDWHLRTRDKDFADRVEQALHTPGAIQVNVMADDQNAVVRVTALLDDGPHLLLEVAPGTIGLEL
jgi:hypothetical protein